MAAPRVTRTQGANADCNPAEPISNIGRVSKLLLRSSYCGTQRAVF